MRSGRGHRGAEQSEQNDSHVIGTRRLLLMKPWEHTRVNLSGMTVSGHTDVS